MVPAYLHSISPISVDNSDFGKVYQVAWYGDGQHYYAPDYIEAFGPLGIYDYITGNTKKILTDKLARRNLAAHPSLVEITQYQAEDAISDLVNNVILKLT